MKLINARWDLMSPIKGDDILKAIESAGRTCYKSEDKITTSSAQSFVEHLVKSGHHSVLEHQSFSVKFICDRGVSHEIVRHRLASFSQESTRYCNYSKDKFDSQLTFIIPPWIKIAPGNYHVIFMGNTVANLFEFPQMEWTDSLWFTLMARIERDYKELINEGWPAQQARAILPNSLKTEIVVTANLREWRTIFTQRCAIAAHPQMREVMIPLLAYVKFMIPVVFDDLYPEIQYIKS